MGKKISIDSASMMNKVFEIIEAKKIFNLRLQSTRNINSSTGHIYMLL